MCGLSGVVGTIGVPDEKNFQRLLIYNVVRGMDSTGAASVKRNKKDEVAIAKELGHPFNLFEIKRAKENDFSDVLAGQHKLLFGHNRSATRGSVTRKNAHPFLFDNVLGMHNGTLNYNYKDKFGTAYSKYETDSEAIISSIDAEGIEATIARMEGAWALAWYDFRNNTFNLLRNKERTLFYLLDEPKQKIYFSSEWEHLASATKELKLPPKPYFLLPENMHYSWTVPDQNKEFDSPVIVKREGFVPKYEVGYRQNRGDHFPFFSGRDEIFEDNREVVSKKGNNITVFPATSLSERLKNLTPFYDSELCCWCKWDRVSTIMYCSKNREGFYIAKVNYLQQNPKPSLLSANKEARFKEVIAECREDEKPGGMIFNSEDLKVYWDRSAGVYNVFKWEGYPKQWVRNQQELCPKEVPYIFHDPLSSGRHFFSHSGKGDKKVIFYKGYNGALLVKQTFEKIMEEGCVVCGGHPKWGNEVKFVSNDIFICEHCNRDTSNYEMLKDYGKQQNRSMN